MESTVLTTAFPVGETEAQREEKLIRAVGLRPEPQRKPQSSWITLTVALLVPELELFSSNAPTFLSWFPGIGSRESMKWARNSLEVTLSRSSSGRKGLTNRDKVKSAGPRGSHLRLSPLESSLRALFCPEQVQGRGRKRWRGEGKRGNKQREGVRCGGVVSGW